MALPMPVMLETLCHWVDQTSTSKRVLGVRQRGGATAPRKSGNAWFPDSRAAIDLVSAATLRFTAEPTAMQGPLQGNLFDAQV